MGLPNFRPCSQWLDQWRWRLGSRDWFPLFLLLGLLVLLALLIGFVQSARARAERERVVRCLALNVYHEARGESRAGQLAVAQITLNRVASPRFPDDVCAVVFEKRWDRLRHRYVAAFSWTELSPDTDRASPAWRQSLAVAREALDGAGDPRLAGALFYHARHIRPSWARHKRPVARIGRHRFYR